MRFGSGCTSVFNLQEHPNDDLSVETAEAIELHDQLLQNAPVGARHDRDICPICVDKATETANPPSRIPPGSAGPDVSDENTQSHTSTEGGTTHTMSDNANTMSEETHKALLAQAVTEATRTTDAALQTVTAERDDLKAKLEVAEADNAALKADNDRINGDLDKAQLELKAATDKAAEAEQELAKERDDRAKADLANARATQVKNLGLFPADYITDEKASAWAGLDEAAWTERVDEWSKLKPAAAGDGSADTASALSGTSEELTKTPEGDDTASDKSKPARRAVLGLS